MKYINCELLYEDNVANLGRVTKLDDGSLFTIVSVCKSVYRKSGYPEHQFVFSRRSFDGGKTWTMPVSLFEIPERHFHCSVFNYIVSRTGTLHVFIVRIKSWNETGNKLSGDILHARMDDVDGNNCTVRKIECLDRYTGALNNLIELESGRIVVPFSTIKPGVPALVSSVIYSDDDGVSWKASNDLSIPSEETHIESGAVEPVVVEVSKNRLVMLIRTVLGCLYFSVSEDGGESWADPQKSGVKSSNSPAVVEKLPDGRIAVVWNMCNGYPMREVRYSMARQCLYAAVSDDGLRTLNGCRFIVKKVKGDPDKVLNCYPYSGLCGDSDVFIRFMVVNSKDGDEWQDPASKLIKVPIKFLYDTEFSDNFSAGLENWVLDYENSGVVCVEEKNALYVKSGADAAGYALVNFPYGRRGKIEIPFETCGDFESAKLILTDNYIDRVNFAGGEKYEKYKHFIDAAYLAVPLAGTETPDVLCIGKNSSGVIVLTWGDGKVCAACGSQSVEIDMPDSFAGFNHAGIVVPCGGNQYFRIKSFWVKAEEARLETGIK